MDLFEKLSMIQPSEPTLATATGDLNAEFDTTQSCAETGCGGGPLGP